MPPGKSGTLIIGLGNQYRCDDAVGLVVARRLKEAAPEHVRVLEESGEGAALMESWKDADTVILIDAVHSGAKPGILHRLDAHTQPMPTRFFHYSTHAFSVAEAIELARALGQLPPRLIVYGVEGKTFEAGLGLSPEVEKAAQKVVERVLGDVGCQNSIPTVGAGCRSTLLVRPWEARPFDRAVQIHSAWSGRRESNP